MIFRNRVNELADIRRIISSNRPEMIIVYGRRGVGKSLLLSEALRGVPHLAYQATTRTMPQQLEDLTAAFRTFAPHKLLGGPFPSVDAFLNAVGQIAREAGSEPTIVIVDELPYLGLAEPALPSLIQRWWDQLRMSDPTNLKVFLLGSLVSWMESQALLVTGPLHNRRTGQLKLEPMRYSDAALFYPDYAPTDKVIAYGVWGGMPAYLADLDPKQDVWTNLRETALVHSSRLADEPAWLRFADLRSDAIYESILRAIATGCHRPAKIAAAVGKKGADDIMYHLERLCDLGLVVRAVPIHERHSARSKNALYRLADHFVAFWYRFVDRSRHLLALRHYDLALDWVRNQMDEYLAAQVFEDVCRDYLWLSLHSRLPSELSFDQLGAWWKGQNGESDEVDIVATLQGRAVLVGECKWSVRPCGARELTGLGAALRKSSHDLNPVDRPWRALFSRSGFDADLLALATDPSERLLLFTPGDLYPSSSAN